jgi:hypothetical protein
MIQFLKSLRKAKIGDGRTGSTGSKSKLMSRPMDHGSDFRAVSLRPSLDCCAETEDTVSKRYLWREAPRLPLQGCAMGSNCHCKFVKHAERRDGDRRLLGGNSTKQWFTGSERRRHHGRRAA